MENYEQILRYAMQMELDGYNFFKEKANEVSGETAKDIFLKLADVEMEHYDYLKDHLDRYKADGTIEIKERVESLNQDIFEERAEKEHVDAALQESDIPDITILRMAYLIERDYKEFYERAAEQATDPDAKKLFTTLAEWESEHETIFKDEYDRRMKDYMTLPWGG